MIEARAGRGKTWLVNLIVATARSEGIVTMCVASTALAAQNYPGGRTAHSQLGIPAAKREKGKRVECKLELGSQHAKFLSSVHSMLSCINYGISNSRNHVFSLDSFFFFHKL